MTYTYFSDYQKLEEWDEDILTRGEVSVNGVDVLMVTVQSRGEYLLDLNQYVLGVNWHKI